MLPSRSTDLNPCDFKRVNYTVNVSIRESLKYLMHDFYT